MRPDYTVGCFFFFFVPFIFFALLFSHPPCRNSDPSSYRRLSSSLPTAVRALHFYRDNISALSSLVDSRLIVLTQARRSQQVLIRFSFLQMNAKSPHGGIRTHGTSPLAAFDGYHRRDDMRQKRRSTRAGAVPGTSNVSPVPPPSTCYVKRSMGLSK